MTSTAGLMAASAMMEAARAKLPNAVVGRDSARVTHESFGDLRVYFEGDSSVGPGAMMSCAAGRVHGVRNTGKTPLLFYYYKWIK